jgi:hypothetical protein
MTKPYNILYSTSSEASENVIDLRDASIKGDKVKVDTGSGYRNLDCGLWYPMCAQHYNLSPDIRNLIMIPVPVLISELPNTNGDCISKNELLQFIPDQGALAYRTFIGKPTFLEHNNQDITQAKGVILDCYLQTLKGFGNDKHYKLVLLLAYDRTKDPELCRKILSGEVNTYSIGVYFDSYSCSICGNKVGKTYGKACSHTALKKPTYLHESGKLAYRHMHGIIAFECSCVVDPAFSMAHSDIILNPQTQFKATL